MNATDATTMQTELLSNLLREIDSGRLTLPVMPDIAVRIKSEAANPMSSAKKLAQVIAGDAALAARILKMANSAIYAGLSEIKDLDHAIGRLGSAMVVALVIGAAGKETFRSTDPQFNTIAEGAWQRSLYASAAARLLGPDLDMPAEEAFLAGLLHSAGEPVLLELIRTMLDSGTLERPSDTMVEQCLEQLAPRAGARLLDKWGLPASLGLAVLHQHDPSAAPREHGRDARLLSLVGGFAAASVRGDASWNDELARTTAALGLEGERVQECFEQAAVQAHTFASAL